MDRVNDELSKIMTRAFTSVKDRVQAEGVTYREAAFLIGLERVAHVAELRGFI
jgi:glutamate dehydrogenase (NAD(P)+)